MQNRNIGDIIKYIYATEKFSMAVYVLATHKGNIKDRLFFAFQEFSAVTEDEIPENIQSDFNWIRQELTKKEAKAPIGRLGQTLLKMRIKKAQK